jgi:hypothetical protein
MNRFGLSLGLALALVAGPAFAQTHDSHRHGGMSQHERSAQESGVPAGSDTDWSYVGRDNPRPVVRNRWTMVPGDSGAMYRSATGLSPAERCRALLGSSRTIVDQATRAACGDGGTTAPSTTPPPPAAAPAPADHSRHH